MDRKIAIIHTDADLTENVRNMVNVLTTNCAADEITVYTKALAAEFNVTHERCSCTNAVLPDGLDSEPKIRNWINSSNAGFDGFLHVISDSVEFLKDPSGFVEELEHMMRATDYSVWFSTVTDGCNYVYSKYNPRMRIACDRPECEKLGLRSGLNFTSHSNTQWIAYDMRALAGSDLLRFDERFTVAMFFIIEFLARRRNTKKDGQPFFMNQYLTVESEHGAFRNFASAKKDDIKQDTLKAEDALFKEVCRDYAPDNNIDVVLETLWRKLSEKARTISK